MKRVLQVFAYNINVTKPSLSVLVTDAMLHNASKITSLKKSFKKFITFGTL